jgi:hypothetical protein
MSCQEKVAEALRLANGLIERQLDLAFTQLDASTHSVETRKLLHAIFVKKAIEVADSCFPGNCALYGMLNRALAGLTANEKTVRGLAS